MTAEYDRLVEEIDKLIRHTHGGSAISRSWSLHTASEILDRLINVHGFVLSGATIATGVRWRSKPWPICADVACPKAILVHRLGPGCPAFDERIAS